MNGLRRWITGGLVPSVGMLSGCGAGNSTVAGGGDRWRAEGPTTMYDGFSVTDFGAIDAGNYVAAKGPLFATVGGNVVGSVEVRSLSAGN